MALSTEPLKVKSQSDPKKVAGAIIKCIEEYGTATLMAIGPAAVNNAVKAIAIARGFIASTLGSDTLCMIPSFATVTIADVEKTAMRMVVEPK